MRELRTHEYEELHRESQHIASRYAAKLLHTDANELDPDALDTHLARLRVMGVLECAAAVEIESMARDGIGGSPEEADQAVQAIWQNAPSQWSNMISKHLHAMSTVMR